MRPAFQVEATKLIRSRVNLVATILLGLLLPAMGLGFYSVAVTGRTGSLADKASALLVGEGWVGYLGFVDQIAAVALFLGAGIVVAWTFGREHVDRTFPALFALPTARNAIAGAKFTVLSIWIAGISILVTVVALILGLVAGVAPLDPGVISDEVFRLLGISLCAGILSLTMGFVASVGRGYLAAIGAQAVIIAVTQIAVLFGTGGWFPFAVPGLLAVAGAEGAPTLSVVQLLLVPGLAVVGIWATLLWWRRAEVVSRWR
jgi:ABC-2 type transport system permease protein